MVTDPNDGKKHRYFRTMLKTPKITVNIQFLFQSDAAYRVHHKKTHSEWMKKENQPGDAIKISSRYFSKTKTSALKDQMEWWSMMKNTNQRKALLDQIWRQKCKNYLLEPLKILVNDIIGNRIQDTQCRLSWLIQTNSKADLLGRITTDQYIKCIVLSNGNTDPSQVARDILCDINKDENDEKAADWSFKPWWTPHFKAYKKSKALKGFNV